MNSVIVSLLPLTLPLLFVWGVVRFLKRSEVKKSAVDSSDSDASAGIGGWLLFLICSLMFIGPLFGGGGINREIVAVESTYPQIVELESWVAFKYAMWWTFVIVSCISVYCGYCLLKRRDVWVVRQAQFMLWVIWPISNLFMGVVLPFVIVGEVDFGPGLLGPVAFSVVMAAIWTLYLSKSKRVKATYGR